MKPTTEQLAKINKLALKKLSEDDVSVHQFLAANMKTSSYFTNFHPHTINKFAYDLAQGQVAMSVMHDTQRTLPPGRGFDAQVGSNKDRDLYGLFYIPTKLDKDNIAERMDAGTLFDVSVGVNVAQYECSICKNDWRTRDCNHWPGMEFNVGTEEKPKMKLCTLTMKGKDDAVFDTSFGPAFSDVRLSEVSPVTDGAIPGARVVPGGFCDMENGKLNFGDGFVLSKIAEGAELKVEAMQFSSTLVRVPVTETEEELDMSDTNKLLEQFEAFKTEVNTKFGKKEEEHVAALAAATTKVAELTTEIAGLRAAFAEVLVGMRTKLEANSFDGEVAKKEFSALPAADMLAKYADLATQVAAKFPSGRTSVKDTDEGTSDIYAGLDNLYKV